MKWLGRRLRGGSSDPPSEPDAVLLGLLAEGGLAAWDRQLAFAEIVGDRDWLLDQETGVLRLGDDLWLPASLLGSFSESTSTWLWAWANESVEPGMLTDAERARQIGAARDLALLTDPYVPAEGTLEGHLIALAISGLLDADAYYRCPYGGGAAYVTVRLSRVRVLHEQPGRHLGELLRRAIVEMPYVVSRTAVESYLESTRVPASVEPDTIIVEDGPTLTFDELGRLTSLEETIDKP